MTSQKKDSGFRVRAEIQGFRVQGSGLRCKGFTIIAVFFLFFLNPEP
jgi:hypothetical protein